MAKQIKNVKRIKRSWSSKEIKFLKENFGTMRDIEIAGTLGRTIGAIRGKARTQGLMQFDRRKKNFRNLNSKKVVSKVEQPISRKSSNVLDLLVIIATSVLVTVSTYAVISYIF